MILDNILVHEYFGVRLQNAWKIAQEDLMELGANIGKMVEELSGEGKT